MTAGTDFGAPPPPAASNNTNYLGVPDNYAYLPKPNTSGFNVFGALGLPTFGDQSGNLRGQPALPRYQTGDDIGIVASMPPETVARLQQALATAGLIGPKTQFRVGLADDTTTNAFKQLLSFANVNGMDWQGALAKLLQTPVTTGGGAATGTGSGGAASGSGVELTNPMDEDMALRNAAQKLLGQDPSPKQLEGFRPYYDALTRSAQTQTTPQAGQSITDQPNVTSAADSYLRQNAGIQVQGENLSHVMDALDGLINGSGEQDFGQKGGA